MESLFVGYPSAVIYELENDDINQPPNKLVALKHLLWGDYLKVLAESDEFYSVSVRGERGWIPKSDTQKERLLEIVFVDVGQGDGALVVTPDDRRYVIDAGQDDNMHRFLRWRFGGFKNKVKFNGAIISHSDMDHYGGFADLFNDPNVFFDSVYTNGLMERSAAKESLVLGELQEIDDVKYVTNLVTSNEELESFLSNPELWKKKVYPSMLEKAFKANKFNEFRMIDCRDEYFPGYESDKNMKIEILGPCVEYVNELPGLRWFGDLGI